MEEFDDDISDEIEGSDEEEKIKIIKQIENYQNTFPDIVNKKTIDKSKNKLKKKYSPSTPLSVLKDDLNNIENEVNNNGMVKDLGGLCVSVAGLIQNLSTKTRLKLNGPKVDLVTIVHNNKECFNQLCKELMCKYDICGVTKPEVRLAMLGVQTIFIVHSENARIMQEDEQLKRLADEKKPEEKPEEKSTGSV